MGIPTNTSGNSGPSELQKELVTVAKRVYLAREQATGEKYTGKYQVSLIPGGGIVMAQQLRGGLRIYVAPDKSFLSVPSSFSTSQALEEFHGGRRSGYVKPSGQLVIHRPPQPEQNNQPQASSQQSPPQKPRRRAPEPPVTPEDDGWAVDPKTGKRYKKLAISPPEAVKASIKNKNAGLTLEQARKMIEVDKDFDIDDWDKTADMFLAHLRVAPDKDEIERLRQERIKKMRQQEAERAAIQKEISDKYGEDDLANG